MTELIKIGKLQFTGKIQQNAVSNGIISMRNKKKFKSESELSKIKQTSNSIVHFAKYSIRSSPLLNYMS